MGLFGQRAPAPGATATAPARPHIQVLRADGQRIDLSQRDAGALLVATRQGWQADAFSYRDLIGEVRFAIRLLSRHVARVRFYVAEQRGEDQDPAPLDGDEHELDSQLAADALHNFGRIPLDGNPDGFTARLVENLSIAGEAWVHIDPRGRFQVRSVSEITASADGRVVLNTLPTSSRAGQRQIDPEQEDLLRCWVPHPEWGELADSPLRVLRDVCEDVVLAGREQRAAARSRVAANGILLLPDSLSLVQQRQDAEAGEEDGPGEDTFMQDFTAAMLAPVQDDGDASAVVPIVIRGAIEDLQEVRHVTLERADAGDLVERQQSGLLRILKGLDIQPEQVEGVGGANHWCVDEETEILTTRGWLHGDDLQIGDLTYTLNHETGLGEWMPVLDIYRADVVDEPMVSMETRTHSSLTTLGHRWPIIGLRGGRNCNVAGQIIDGRHSDRLWATSETLTVRDSIPTCAVSADRPIEAKYTDDLVELVAWFWTEGNIPKQGAVSIAQSHTKNAERVERIRAALTRLYGPASDNLYGKHDAPRWREYVQPNNSAFGGPITVFALCRKAASPLIEAAPGKMVSREFVLALTPAQLELFIDISAQGDGWHYRSGGRLDMWQRNPVALDGYELALVLSGRMISRGISDGGYWVCPLDRRTINPVKSNSEAVRLGRPEQVTHPRYTGRIWCPTTENSTWFARRRGKTYFTGNSAWIIDSRSIRDQVQPTAETVAACLAQAFLRPALLSLGHDENAVDRVTIAVDVSPLAENPNRGQDARDAHASLVISDEALRQALGFDEDDAPSEEECLRRIASSGRLPVDLAAVVLGVQRPGQPITINGQTVPEQRALPASPPSGPPSGQQDRPQAGPGIVTPTNPVPAEPTQVVAAAVLDEATGWLVDDDAGRRLADIDAELAERITVAADAALARVIERAGARVRTAARNDRAAMGAIGGVDAAYIPSRLGRERVEAFVPIADLLQDGYARLRGQVGRWMGQAAVQIADVVVDLLRLRGAAADRVRVQVADRLGARTDLAWQTLAERLDAAAETALFQPDPLSPDPGPGEPVETLIAPADVEDVLRVAGGGRPIRESSHTETPRLESTPGPGGYGTGPDVTALLAEHGALLLGWEWQYRHAIKRQHPFAPWHTELDGVRFATFTDPVLDTTPETEWIGPYFFPQDHRGCRCRAIPIMSVVERPDPDDDIVARRLREAAADPRNRLADEVAAEDAAAGRVGTSLQQESEVRRRLVEQYIRGANT